MTDMNRRAALLLLAVIALAPMSAAWYSEMSETEDFDRTTPPKVLQHKLSEQAAGTHLHVKMTVKEGSVDMKLVDAAGALRLHRILPKGTTKFDQQFDGRPGAWKVQLAFRNARGKYNVRLIDY
jgi:hypothetical protein